MPRTGCNDDDLAAACAALANPVRLQILRSMVSARISCFSVSLAQELGLSPQALVDHLRDLREAGLVQGAITLPVLCFCVKKDSLAWVAARLNELSGSSA
jgi:predicted transcriptional regulator